MKLKYLTLFALPLLLASCTPSQDQSYTETTVPRYINGTWVYADDLSYHPRARIVAVSGVNTPENPWLGKVINNQQVVGQVHGNLVDYYYLDVKQGQGLVLESNNPELVFVVEGKEKDPTLYPLLLANQVNPVQVTDRIRIAVMVQDLKKTTGKVNYTFTIKVQEQ